MVPSKLNTAASLQIHKYIYELVTGKSSCCNSHINGPHSSIQMCWAEVENWPIRWSGRQVLNSCCKHGDDLYEKNNKGKEPLSGFTCTQTLKHTLTRVHTHTHTTRLRHSWETLTTSGQSEARVNTGNSTCRLTKKHTELHTEAYIHMATELTLHKKNRTGQTYLVPNAKWNNLLFRKVFCCVFCYVELNNECIIAEHA